jgi:hypothetical protein
MLEQKNPFIEMQMIIAVMLISFFAIPKALDSCLSFD